MNITGKLRSLPLQGITRHGGQRTLGDKHIGLVAHFIMARDNHGVKAPGRKTGLHDDDRASGVQILGKQIHGQNLRTARDDDVGKTIFQRRMRNRVERGTHESRLTGRTASE